MSDSEIKIIVNETNKEGQSFPQTPKPQIFVERISSNGMSVKGDKKNKNSKMGISIGFIIIFVLIGLLLFYCNL